MPGHGNVPWRASPPGDRGESTSPPGSSVENQVYKLQPRGYDSGEQPINTVRRGICAGIPEDEGMAGATLDVRPDPLRGADSGQRRRQA